MDIRSILTAALALSLAACGADNDPGYTVPDGDDAVDAPAEPDAPADLPADVATEPRPDGPDTILPDCSACPSVGTTLENLRCAVDLCDDDVFVDQTYTSPVITNAANLERSRAAVARFGDPGNDLEPLLGGSYALISTGWAVPSSPPDAYDHNQTLTGGLIPASVPDPHASSEEWPAYDVVEWTLTLRAPMDAHGFQIHYVFFSVEYDEYVGREFNDKFYMLLVAESVSGMEHPIINYTQCRPSVDTPDFVCPTGMPGCTAGEELCYIAINSALSECCWYDGCTTMDSNTDITGTGFECGTEDVDYVGDYSMGFTYGSSTGWLVTEWPVEPGELFTIRFHLHDTADCILDSTVLIDKFVFVRDADPGTDVLI
jgi:hypothetical protein